MMSGGGYVEFADERLVFWQVHLTESSWSKAHQQLQLTGCAAVA
jgi:hypothetical protein